MESRSASGVAKKISTAVPMVPSSKNSAAEKNPIVISNSPTDAPCSTFARIPGVT